ncbi:MAG TPA: hypothetical protein QGF02_04830 [Candidatus Babeliales bacterium]|nr:hypothetical protein [Candidatus Babeliales bacterium]
MMKMRIMLGMMVAVSLVHAGEVHKDILFDTELATEFIHSAAPFIDLSRVDAVTLGKVHGEINAACKAGGVITCLRSFGHIIKSYTDTPRLMPAGLVTHCLDLLERSGEDKNLVAVATINEKDRCGRSIG